MVNVVPNQPDHPPPPLPPLPPLSLLALRRLLLYSTTPDPFDQLCEPFRLNLVPHRRPCRENRPLAMQIRLNKDRTAAYAVKIELRRDGRG